MTETIQLSDSANDGRTASGSERVRRGTLSRPAVLLGIISLCIVFFMITSPRSVPSVLLIAGFTILGLLLFAGLQLCLQIAGLGKGLSRPLRRGIVITGTVLPVLLLMLQSIGQLTVRDILTLGGLFLIGIFYAMRMQRSLRH